MIMAARGKSINLFLMDGEANGRINTSKNSLQKSLNMMNSWSDGLWRELRCLMRNLWWSLKLG